MKSKGNIVFLGMMGSGKSSIGKIISKKLKLDFYDVDNIIEEHLKMKISEIFSKKGEFFFRKIEEKITMDTLKKKNILLALGGGSFLNKNIRNEILKKHLSFWLYLNDFILIQRIKNNPKRPIAFTSTKEELVDLIKKRSKVYSKALYKINCNNLTKYKIALKIMKIYESKKIKN